MAGEANGHWSAIKKRQRWREARAEAKEDPTDVLATTIILVEDLGKKVDRLADVVGDNEALQKEEKAQDDKRHRQLERALIAHCAQPYTETHLGGDGEPCPDGLHCGDEKAQEKKEEKAHPTVQLLTNKNFCKVLAGVLTVLALVLTGSVLGGGV